MDPAYPHQSYNLNYFEANFVPGIYYALRALKIVSRSIKTVSRDSWHLYWWVEDQLLTSFKEKIAILDCFRAKGPVFIPVSTNEDCSYLDHDLMLQKAKDYIRVPSHLLHQHCRCYLYHSFQFLISKQADLV